MHPVSLYSLEVANTPDADGHYRASVKRGQSVVKTIYDYTREDVITKATSWVEADRNHDPSDTETITL